MIDLRDLDQYRRVDLEIARNPPHGNRWPSDCGFFVIPSPSSGEPMRCIVSAGRLDPSAPPWDHVSVSLENRCPTWQEMDYLARLFFKPTEAAMQLHVPASEHVNCHPYCLHIWRPSGLKKIPLPPSWMVGPDSAKGKK